MPRKQAMTSSEHELHRLPHASNGKDGEYVNDIKVRMNRHFEEFGVLLPLVNALCWSWVFDTTRIDPQRNSWGTEESHTCKCHLMSKRENMTRFTAESMAQLGGLPANLDGDIGWTLKDTEDLRHNNTAKLHKSLEIIKVLSRVISTDITR